MKQIVMFSIEYILEFPVKTTKFGLIHDPSSVLQIFQTPNGYRYHQEAQYFCDSTVFVIP
jgi:hypothetical protein